MENADWKYSENSFDYIRLISALLIVLGHIVIHLNCKVIEPVNKLQQSWAGLICLFVISGYFIPYSLERSKSKMEYIIKRAIRIYPALLGAFLVSFMTVIILGIYKSGIVILYKDIIAWVISQITIFQFYTPPGLKAYGVGNPNGALWTISMELQIYILIMLFYNWLKKQKIYIWLIMIGCGIACNILFPLTERLMPATLFKLINVTFIPYLYIYLIGIFIYTYRNKMIPVLKRFFIPLLIAYIVWCFINTFLIHFKPGHYINIVSGLFLSILTLGAGYYFGNHRLKHDFSYSIYLYHMIVINALLVLGIKENIAALLLTYLITLLFSFLSVYIIEKNARIILNRLKTRKRNI